MLEAPRAERRLYHSRAAGDKPDGAFPLQKDTSGGRWPQAGWNRGMRDFVSHPWFCQGWDFYNLYLQALNAVWTGLLLPLFVKFFCRATARRKNLPRLEAKSLFQPALPAYEYRFLLSPPGRKEEREGNSRKTWTRRKGSVRQPCSLSPAFCLDFSRCGAFGKSQCDLRAYPKIMCTPLAPHIFRHTASLSPAGRQPACGKAPCLAKNLRHNRRTPNFRISS